MQSEATARLILTEEAGWLQLGVGEAQVLMQVVQPRQEVSQMSTQHTKHPVIAVLRYVAHEGQPTLFHQLINGPSCDI